MVTVIGLGTVIVHCRLFLCYRGQTFRTAFEKIGTEIIPLFPQTPVMVFSATASSSEQNEIIKKLNLRAPKIVVQNPDRENIKYIKIERPPSTQQLEHLDQLLRPIAEDLITNKDSYPITIFYTEIRLIGYCYWYLEKALGAKQYVGGDKPEHRLFGQYHSTYTEEMKSIIVKQLCQEKSTLRLVFATVALGMGLNAKHVQRIIHYIPPTCLSKYFQETGRAGRDGQPATATLYYNATDIRSNRPGIHKDIVKYCKNTTECYRKVMLERFGFSPLQTTAKNRCCSFCDEK